MGLGGCAWGDGRAHGWVERRKLGGQGKRLGESWGTHLRGSAGSQAVGRRCTCAACKAVRCTSCTPTPAELPSATLHHARLAAGLPSPTATGSAGALAASAARRGAQPPPTPCPPGAHRRGLGQHLHSRCISLSLTAPRQARRARRPPPPPCRQLESPETMTSAKLIERIVANRALFEERQAKKTKSEAAYYQTSKTFLQEI